MKLYVASSWRNLRQPEIVQTLTEAGHQVYDFRHPGPGLEGFSWRQIDDLPPQQWSPERYLEILQHPIAQAGFKSDMAALHGADATVLVLPCGRSAHLELGYATGAGQRTYVLLDQAIDEPELMYLMNTRVCLSLEQLKGELAKDWSPQMGDPGAFLPNLPGFADLVRDITLNSLRHAVETERAACAQLVRDAGKRVGATPEDLVGLIHSRPTL